MGCASQPASQADASVDDSGDPFGDLDAGDPFAIDGSLGTRARLFLRGCNGQDGCHLNNAGRLTFPSDDEARFLVDASAFEEPSLLRVRLDDPARSYLYLKLTGDPKIQGSRMPPTSSFDPRLPALFAEWIEAGAPGR